MSSPMYKKVICSNFEKKKSQVCRKEKTLKEMHFGTLCKKASILRIIIVSSGRMGNAVRAWAFDFNWYMPTSRTCISPGFNLRR